MSESKQYTEGFLFNLLKKSSQYGINTMPTVKPKKSNKYSINRMPTVKPKKSKYYINRMPKYSPNTK